jgi:tRNA 2-selenouridine synthase
MMPTLDIAQFLKRQQKHPVIDVRTPAEYSKGHIPGAYNIPLFDEAERAEVGLIYKQQNREEAILRGLDFVGPKMRSLIEAVKEIVPTGEILIYCWRGGMRSQSVSWLLNLYGYQTYTLIGGYKAFRREVLACLEQAKNILILGGKTGSGKTDILLALGQLGQDVIDLEGLARHKGSAFGAIGQAPQPSQQTFENELSRQWRHISSESQVWLEDESQRIGKIVLPKTFWDRMQTAQTVYLEVPLALRVDRLVAEYGTYPHQNLEMAIHAIEKRLGPQHAKQALDSLHHGDLEACCHILLTQYYDKAYLYGLARKQKEQVQTISISGTDATENAKLILNTLSS